MVCLGNICRSPLAEGLLKARARAKGLGEFIQVDSAGTADYHGGDAPDWRSCEVAEKNGFKLTHIGRQFVWRDFKNFDSIFVMDDSNYQDVIALAKTDEDKKKVRILAKLDPDLKFGPIVKDPYYDDIDAFHEMFSHLDVCIGYFLKELGK